MADSVFRKEEFVGTSANSITDAINNAVAVASRSVGKVTWFEVLETRGHVEDGQVSQYQVVLKVGFKMEA